MNRRVRPAKIFAARIMFAAVALVLLFQTAGRALAQDRWLLIFESSAAMKKRLPAVEVALQKLFFTSMDGQLHGGDSLGVWTVDQKLHVGEFPLSTWQPEHAAETTSNLVAFLRKRTYKGEVNFNALQPVLGEVVTGSQRLTVLIFCEGQGEIIWTPYNDAINQSLRQNYDERKKSNQPFVILLRVQEGKYFGCSLNFPPGAVSFPTFPKLPEEILPAAVTNVVAAPEKKAPPLDTSPLIIVGKSAATNTAQPPAATVPAPLTNDDSGTNASGTMGNTPTGAVTSVVTAATNAAVGAAAMAAAVRPSAKPIADNGDTVLILIGGLALLLAVVLVILLVLRARQPQGSLISDSLNAPRSPPRKL
jgi:hypothetical protein